MRLRAALTVAVTAAALLVPSAAATAQPESMAKMVTDPRIDTFGHDRELWANSRCTTFELRPNVAAAGDPVDARRVIAEAAGVINAAVGRQLMRLGADTTAHFDDHDSLRVVEIVTGEYGGGMADIDSVAVGGGYWRITDGDVVAWDWEGSSAFDASNDGRVDARAELVDTVVHELGHMLGLGHTPDVSDVMSYPTSFHGRAPGFSPGTVRALRFLFTGDCSEQPYLDPVVDWRSQARAKRMSQEPFVGGHAATLERARTIVDIGVEHADGWDDEPVCPWCVDGYDASVSELRRAVVCRDDVFADCLAGAPLAGRDGALLFVPGGPDGRLPADVRATLDRLLPSGRDVYVLGGDQAVSTAVERSLDQGGWAVTRLGGDGRYHTAALVAQTVVDVHRPGANVDLVVVSRGDDPADAVTVAAAAVARRAPIVLTDPRRLPDATTRFLATHRPAAAVLTGGGSAISGAVADRIDVEAGHVSRAQGVDRTATSTAIATHPRLWNRAHPGQRNDLAFVDGYLPETWALALSAAPTLARLGQPLLLTSGANLTYGAASGTLAASPGRWLLDLDHPDPSQLPTCADGWYCDHATMTTVGTPDGRFTPAHLGGMARHLVAYCRIYDEDCAR